MRKCLIIVIAIIAAMVLVSCSTTGNASAEEAVVLSVKTLDELAATAKTAPKGATIVLDGDIVWNPEYTSEACFEIKVAKRITIDLNGHSISNVKSGALRFFGNFTLKNGTITGGGDSYGLLVNSKNTTSGVNYKVETRESHRVTLENLKLVDCGIRAELSRIDVINCDITNNGESGNSNCLYFVGVEASIEGGRLNQANQAAIETISRTNCVYCSGNSSVKISNVVLEGTKRLNAYKNTVAFRVYNCKGYTTATPDLVR